MRLLAWSLLLASSAPGAEWPQFRGPRASGVASQPVVVEWDGGQDRNILWRREIPGLGHSSPVVWGDRLFLTSAVPEQGEPGLKLGLYGEIRSVEAEGAQAFKVFCLDRKTGAVLWERTAAKRPPRFKRHPKATHANPTPATDGQRLIAFFGAEGLYAYDFTGKLLWERDLGPLDAGYFEVPSAQWGFASSPVLHDGKVIVQADVQRDSFLAAYDAASGKELWKTPRTDVPTWSTPAIAPYTAPGGPREQVVVNGWKHIGGYDLSTGRELWRMRGGGDIPVPTPILGGDLVLFTSAHGPGRPIYAVRANAAGPLGGQSQAIAWQHERAGNYMQTPLAYGGLAYFCYDNGVLSVFEVATGKRVYQQRLGDGRTGFTSSPVAAGNHLYLTNEDGRTYVLRLGRDFRLVAENELGESVMASPAIAGGVLYLRGRKHLFAIGAR